MLSTLDKLNRWKTNFNSNLICPLVNDSIRCVQIVCVKFRTHWEHVLCWLSSRRHKPEWPISPPPNVIISDEKKVHHPHKFTWSDFKNKLTLSERRGIQYVKHVCVCFTEFNRKFSPTGFRKKTHADVSIGWPQAHTILCYCCYIVFPHNSPLNPPKNRPRPSSGARYGHHEKGTDDPYRPVCLRTKIGVCTQRFPGCSKHVN